MRASSIKLASTTKLTIQMAHASDRCAGPSCRSHHVRLATHDATASLKGGTSFGIGATDTVVPPRTALECNLQAPDEGLVLIVIDFRVAISPPFGLDLGTFPFDVVADPSFNSR